jgi:hypothetical protein
MLSKQDNKTKTYIPSEYNDNDTHTMEKIAYVKNLSVTQLESLLEMGFTVVFNE